MKPIVIVTAYNVERTLARTLAELPRACWDELILVDDGSQDATLALARSLGIPCIAHGRNRGYGAAQKSGFRAALERHADLVVLLHADHQYDARCVPEMLSLILRGEADAVMGSRRLGGRCLEGGMPRWKLAGNVVLTGLINACLGTRLTDPHSGLRVYSSRYLDSVPFATYAEGFLFDTQIIFDGVRQGMRIREVPIPTRYFPEASQMNAWTGLGYAAGIVALSAASLAHSLIRGSRFTRGPQISEVH